LQQKNQKLQIKIRVVMKTPFLLVLAIVLGSFNAEASMLVSSSSETTAISTAHVPATGDLDLLKRKKYKHKKRRNVNRSRYRQGGLFGR
jgi:hypothetical protein